MKPSTPFYVQVVFYAIFVILDAHSIHTNPTTSPSSSSSSYYYTPPNAICTSYSIPIRSTASVLTFDPAAKWSDNAALTQFVIDYSGRVPGLNNPMLASSAHNQSSTYMIGATFCAPKASRTMDGNMTVLLASHGLGFDRRYWNTGFRPQEHNFVEHAIDQGYSVFFYDRLGLGGSSKRLSGFENQLAIQLDILTQLSGLLKAGNYTGDLGTPKNVVLIGHSFGSVLSHAVAAYTPNAVDGVVLTGYNVNSTALLLNIVLEAWNIRIASSLDGNFSGFDAGYVSWVDLYANINTFFKASEFTLDAAQYSEANKQPFAVGEMLTATFAPFPIRTFKGPALLIAGEYDFIFCDGFCPDVINHPASEIFGASKDFKAYIQPNTGHNLNFHQNATGFFGVVTDFLKKNGL